MFTIIVTPQERAEFIANARNDPVYMVENMFFDEFGITYKLEDYQKQFLRCDALYKLLFWARRLSKSFLTKMDMIHKMIFNPSFKCLCVTPSWSQAHDWGDDISEIVNRSEVIKGMFSRTGSEKIKLHNGSRLDTASAGNSGINQLGRGVNYIAFDEAQQIPDVVHGFIRPIIRGQNRRHKAYITYAGTPLGKIGRFWEIYNNAQIYIKKDGVYKNTLEDADGDFVVFERQTAYLDDQLEEIIDSGTNRVTVPELKQDRKEGMTEVEFLREYCLHWLDAIGEVFSRDLLGRVIDNDMRPINPLDEDEDKTVCYGDCVMGLDIGKHRNKSVLTIGEIIGDSQLQTKSIIEWPLETDYRVIADDIFRLQPRFPNTLELRVDQTGVGEGFIEILDDRAYKWRGLEVEGFNFAGRDKKKSLVESGLMQLQQGRVKLFHHSKLYDEMLEFRREITDKNNIIYHKPSGGTDDYVDSLLLCIESAREWTEWGHEEPEAVSVGTRLLDGRKDRLRDYRRFA